MMLKVATTALAALGLSGCSGETTTDLNQNPPAEETSVGPADATAVLAQADPAISTWIAEHYAGIEDILFAVGETDLDGDGQDEILAYVGGPMLCGTGGCYLVVLERAGQDLELLGMLTVSQLPVGAFESSTNGWRDLAVTVYGGGVEQGVARVPFGEDQYASNPTVEPAQITEDTFEIVIPEAPLQPLD